ncbi:MAG: CPBP family intramembrane metalloprotease [Roseiflexaceae bacterium]|nr:CPBP family intramembrane metalloprotease [Roseiflexaceae bacterium]
MAETNLEFTTPAPAARRLWPLAGVVWIDLLITVALIFIGVLAVQIVGLGIAAFQQGLSLDDIRRLSPQEQIALIGMPGVFISVLLQNVICVAIPLIRIGLVRREPLARIGITSAQWPRNLAIGVGVGLAALITNIAFGWFFSRVLGIENDQSAQMAQFFRPGDLLGQALFAVMTIVLAPIGEETLFRGYLFNALRSAGGRGWLVAAYLISAGLFASIHLSGVSQGAVGLLFPLFVMALIFTAATHWTGSLVPAIVGHALNNSLVTFGLIACVNFPTEGCPI